jgi:hypothetical protein
MGVRENVEADQYELYEWLSKKEEEESMMRKLCLQLKQIMQGGQILGGWGCGRR